MLMEIRDENDNQVDLFSFYFHIITLFYTIFVMNTMHIKIMIVLNRLSFFKGLIHFSKTFPDNLLTHMSSKISMSFFLQSRRNTFFF